MNIRSLSSGLSFRGKVQGQKQAYYVFEGPKLFLVFSFSRSKLKYVGRLTKGQQGVTAQSLYKRSRNPKLVGSSLEALSVLYVLVGMGRARIDRRFKTRQLFFNMIG